MPIPAVQARALAILSLTSATFAAPCTYTVTPLALPEGAVRADWPAIAGPFVTAAVRFPTPSPTSPYPTHPFRWTDGTPFDLFADQSPAVFANPTAVSSTGDVVGYFAVDNSSPYHAFLHHAGVFSELLPPAGADGAIAHAVNSLGDAVGSFTSPDSSNHALVWHAGTSTPYLLPEPPNSRNSVAAAVDDGGNILINAYPLDSPRGRAWLYDGTSLIPLAPAGTDSYAYALNNANHAVGNDLSTNRPFFFDGSAYALLPLTADATAGGAFALNAFDDVVGFVRTGIDSTAATLWLDGTPYDLNALLPADSGWTLDYATGINDQSQIVGVGTYLGQPAAFLLTPTPEPSATALLFSTIPPLLYRRRKPHVAIR